jgi:hypothetical protein
MQGVNLAWSSDLVFASGGREILARRIVTRKTRAKPYVSAKSVSIESTAKREPQSATRGPVGPKGKTDMPELIVVTLELPRDEAAAFAELLKRTSKTTVFGARTGTNVMAKSARKWTLCGRVCGWLNRSSPTPRGDAPICRKTRPDPCEIFPHPR